MSRKIFIVGLLIGIFLVLTGLIVFKALTKEEPTEFANELPAFELITQEGHPFTSDSLGTGKTIVIFYSPDCLFCEHEGKELVNCASNFTDIQILFISCFQIDSVSTYIQLNAL